MTSMPASRNARAMTLTPRSCPSKPGFAMSTRIFFAIPITSVKEGLLPHSEDLTHHAAHLAQGGPRADRVQDERHRVRVLVLAGLAERVEGALPFPLVPARADAPQAFDLSA